MNYPRVVTRVIAAWEAHKLAKRCRKGRQLLFKACPDLATLSGRRAVAIRQNRKRRDIERRLRARMNGLLEG